MKKKILLVIILFSLFITVGCSLKKEEDNQNALDNKTSEKLLKGYPKDILPLYKVVDVREAIFNHTDDHNSPYLKDYYQVLYISNGNIGDISNYYQSLMTKVNGKEKETFDKYSFSGNINEYSITVSICDICTDGDNVSVVLSIDLLEKDYVNKNPYFTNYPDDLVDVYRKILLQQAVYSKDYFKKEDSYITIYKTDMSGKEFLDHYETKYKNKNGFKNIKNNYGSKLSWNDQGFNVEINYIFSGDYPFVSIYARIKQ